MKANWREEILYAVTLLMESCWLGALLLFLNELVADGRQFSIIWLWLIYPAAFLLNRLLSSLGWRWYYRYAINGLALVLGTLLLVKTQLYGGYNLLDGSWLSALRENMFQVFQAFQPEVLAIIGCGLLFWRGWHLARHGATFAAVGTSFQFGLSILLAILFVSHLTGVSFPNAILLVIVFSFLALLGLGLCRSAEGTAGQAVVSAQGSQLLLAAVGLILLLGLIVASFITTDLLHLMLDALRWVVGIILKILAFLLSFLPEPEPAEPAPAAPMPGGLPPEAFRPWTLPEPIRDILGKLWVSGFIVGVAFVLYRVFSDIWYRLRGIVTRGASIEPIPGTFRANLIGALMRLVYRILRILFPWRIAHRYRRVAEGESQELSSIRHIYRGLLQWGAEAGWPRRVNETPYEYLGTLGATLPAVGQGQLSGITEAYVIARYRQNWEGEEPLRQVKESWKKLRRLKLKKSGQEQALCNKNYFQEEQDVS